MRLYTPLLRMFGVRIGGTPRYISTTCRFDDLSKITIGNRVVISGDVRFLTHDYSLTTALIAIGETPATDVASEREIIVGNNVFIGLKTIIMPGTIIGDNVIVGAGSVVRGHIKNDSVVVGNPASVVGNLRDYAERWKSRFDTGLVRCD